MLMEQMFRYGTVLYLLTQFLLPFLLISILNTVMVRTIMAAKKQRAMLTISEKSEHRTAIMMVIVVVTFACCYTLSVRSPHLLNFVFLLGKNLFLSVGISGGESLGGVKWDYFLLFPQCL